MFTAENFVLGTLPQHVLGQCPFWAIIRNRRHNKIRTLISNAYRIKQYLEVYEQVIALVNEGSIRIRRSDIKVLNRKINLGLIIDQTIRLRFGCEEQPK